MHTHSTAVHVPLALHLFVYPIRIPQITDISVTCYSCTNSTKTGTFSIPVLVPVLPSTLDRYQYLPVRTGTGTSKLLQLYQMKYGYIRNSSPAHTNLLRSAIFGILSFLRFQRRSQTNYARAARHRAGLDHPLPEPLHRIRVLGMNCDLNKSRPSQTS